MCSHVSLECRNFVKVPPKHKLVRYGKEYPNSLLLRDKTQHIQSGAWNPNHLFPIIGLKASIPLAHLDSLYFLKRSKLLPMHSLFCKCSFSVWCWGVLSEVSSSEKHYLTLPVNITQDNPPSTPFILFDYLNLFTGLLFMSLHSLCFSSSIQGQPEKAAPLP